MGVGGVRSKLNKFEHVWDPPLHGQNDRHTHNWKHYLPETSLSKSHRSSISLLRLFANKNHSKGSFMSERKRKRHRSRWVHRESYWVFTLGSDKDQRKNYVPFRFCSSKRNANKIKAAPRNISYWGFVCPCQRSEVKFVSFFIIIKLHFTGDLGETSAWQIKFRV